MRDDVTANELWPGLTGSFESSFRQLNACLYFDTRLSNNPGLASINDATIGYHAEEQSPSMMVFRTPPGKRNVMLLLRFFGCLAVGTKCGIGPLRKWWICSNVQG
jgi:hypothetical protein